MLEVSRSKISNKYTNLMSFHADKFPGPMILLDKLSQEELKHYAAIGLEKSVRDFLGSKADSEDLTIKEVQTAVEALFNPLTECP